MVNGKSALMYTNEIEFSMGLMNKENLGYLRYSDHLVGCFHKAEYIITKILANFVKSKEILRKKIELKC